MEGISKGTETQLVLLKLDWSTLAKANKRFNTKTTGKSTSTSATGKICTIQRRIFIYGTNTNKTRKSPSIVVEIIMLGDFFIILV